MHEPVDEHFVEQVRRLTAGSAEATADAGLLLALFDAQLQSRHLDFAARRLQAQGDGFYTIGSAGHEANAAVGLLTPGRRPGAAALPVRRASTPPAPRGTRESTPTPRPTRSETCCSG